MDDRGISIEELVERSELSEPKIARFLAAEAEPTASELLRLAGALEAGTSQLLERISWGSDG